MPDTILTRQPIALDDLRARLKETETELQQIAEGGVALFKQIDALVRAYAEQHGCETSVVLTNIDDEIVSLVSDAGGPAWRRKCALENSIAALEDGS